MELRLLGALDIDTGNGHVSVPAGKPRSLLILLALHPNESVSSDRIVDALWGERPPASATAIVQTYVSRLRRALGDGRIETVGHGYRLVLEDGGRDVDRVEALRERAATEPPPEAARSLRDALSLFRGQPLADVAREEFAQADLRRLEELRATLLADRIDADLQRVKHADVLAELEGRRPMPSARGPRGRRCGSPGATDSSGRFGRRADARRLRAPSRTAADRSATSCGLVVRSTWGMRSPTSTSGTTLSG